MALVLHEDFIMVNTKLYIAVVTMSPSFYIAGYDQSKQNVTRINMSFSKEELQTWVKAQKERSRVLRSRVALLHEDKINSISLNGEYLAVSVYRRGSLMTDHKPQYESTTLKVPEDARENMAYLVEFIGRWKSPSAKIKVV